MDIAVLSNSTAPFDASAPENWCKTQFKVVKFNMVWHVENFSFCTNEVGEPLDSPRFSVDPNDAQQPQWLMRLFPRGEESAAGRHMGLYLILANETSASTSAKYTFAILNAQREHINAKVKSEATKFGELNCWGYKEFVRRDFVLAQQNALLPNDRLSIFCEVSMVVAKVNSVGRSGAPVPRTRLVDDMGAMLERELLADCALSSEGRQFQAHKAVLACRSPVFAAMFSNDTEEKRTNRVEIEDIPAPVLSQLLHFLYTGCEPKLLAERDMAEELLAAAEKYQLLRLKALCENQLCLAMSKENAHDMLALADLYSAEHLKARAIEFIRLHPEETTKRLAATAPFASSANTGSQYATALLVPLALALFSCAAGLLIGRFAP